MSSTGRTDSNRSPNRVGVLISGRGSNLKAILDRIASGDLDAHVALVISNVPGAGGLDVAREAGVDAMVIDHHETTDRESHDRRLADALESRSIRLVCLAGYMRILSPWFVRRFKGRILNIHPSLLPSFPGTDAAADAVAYGVLVSGCTVHFVDEGLDSGPILLQRAVPVQEGDTPESLAARILEQEHRLYSEAIARFFSGGWMISGRRVLPGRGQGG